MNKLNLVAICLISFVSASSGAVAGNGNGDSPNGKPFVTINEQIIEVQGAITSLEDQIDMVVGQVDTLEGRVTATEAAITTVESANASLQTLVNQNLSDIASIQGQISALEAENDSLQVMIIENGGDIETLEAQIATNSQLISDLQQALLNVEDGYISMGEGLQDQIDDNAELIMTLQADIDVIAESLEFQQNLAAGVCPNGTAVVDVQADGSYICASAGTSTGGGTPNLITTWAVGPDFYIQGGSYGGQYVHCPPEYVAIDAGYYISTRNVDVIRLYTFIGTSDINSNNRGEAYGFFYNNNSYQTRVHVIATCLKPY